LKTPENDTQRNRHRATGWAKAHSHEFITSQELAEKCCDSLDLYADAEYRIPEWLQTLAKGFIPA